MLSAGAVWPGRCQTFPAENLAVRLTQASPVERIQRHARSRQGNCPISPLHVRSLLADCTVATFDMRQTRLREYNEPTRNFSLNVFH